MRDNNTYYYIVYRYIMYLRNIISLNKSYRPSYMRATPFFGGLAMSLVVEKLKGKKMKFSQVIISIPRECYRVFYKHLLANVLVFTHILWYLLTFSLCVVYIYRRWFSADHWPSPRLLYGFSVTALYSMREIDLIILWNMPCTQLSVIVRGQ